MTLGIIGRGDIKYEDPEDRTTKTMSTETARKPWRELDVVQCEACWLASEALGSTPTLRKQGREGREQGRRREKGGGRGRSRRRNRRRRSRRRSAHMIKMEPATRTVED